VPVLEKAKVFEELDKEMSIAAVKCHYKVIHCITKNMKLKLGTALSPFLP